jgi:acetyl-CoA carboxylase carboxyl transferase subunit beta
LLHPVTEEWDDRLRSADPLQFPGYAERLAGLPAESVRTGRTADYVLIEGDFAVLGGSMGAAHGEAVVRAYDQATDLGLPVVLLTRSGGARMQEGMISLIQLQRTAAAARRHADAGLLSVAVHGSPTVGGVFASYGSLADVRAAVAGATVGFAGPRVVEEVTGTPIDRSHTAASAWSAGLIDAVVEPAEVAGWVEGALGLVDRPMAARPLGAESRWTGETGAWGEVLRSRRRGRPTGLDVAARLCSSWTELHGTDETVRAGLATIERHRAVVVASDRYAGSGRPGPRAFALAQRAIALAGRVGLPLVTLVDTPGADPSSQSEAGGIALEIARTFSAMAALPTASVSICVGEGGSGGALALAGADRLLIQEHAVFSVIGPEGAAVILERDAGRAPEVAGRLGLTSADLLRLGIVDEVVPDDVEATCEAISDALDVAKPGQRVTRVDAATARSLD